jgi:hypothetical protein
VRCPGKGEISPTRGFLTTRPTAGFGLVTLSPPRLVYVLDLPLRILPSLPLSIGDPLPLLDGKGGGGLRNASLLLGLERIPFRLDLPSMGDLSGLSSTVLRPIGAIGILAPLADPPPMGVFSSLRLSGEMGGISYMISCCFAAFPYGFVVRMFTDEEDEYVLIGGGRGVVPP